MNPTIRACEPAEYASALARAKRQGFLSKPSADDLTAATLRCLAIGNGGELQGGGYLSDDGRVCGLFALERGIGQAILAALIDAGATRLDCLGEGLRAYYESHGFHVVDSAPWDDALAPDDWNPADGRPTWYEMARV